MTQHQVFALLCATYAPTAAAVPTEQGRIVLAHGEITGHAHAVDPDLDALGIPAAQLFEEPSGRRVLLAVRPCALSHEEHGRIPLDPEHPTQARQGDVLLTPIGRGAWEVTRQREYSPEAIRNVQD